MPNWNRARVCNLYFNEATRHFDDFRMSFGGKATTYELINGGGKTLFLLAMIQNVLPNAWIDEDQPFKDVFKKVSQNETVHSLLEWNLDDDFNYRYLLTGFCAREKRDKVDENNETIKEKGVEYFNYCIFYNAPNENDINNLPLKTEVDGKIKRMSFTETKAYLKRLKDSGVAVKVFDGVGGGRGAYLKFLSEYNIFEAEWNIIKSINKTENYIKDYFRNTMKTSRKLVENFLLPIIEKSNANKVNSDEREDILVATLFSIRENLRELISQKEKSKEYEDILSGYEELKTYMNLFKNVFSEQEEKIKIFNETYNYLIEEIDTIVNQLEQLQEEHRQKEIQLKEVDLSLMEISAQKNVVLKKEKEDEITLKEDLIEQKECLLNQKKEELATKQAINEYIKYKEEENSFNSEMIRRESIAKENAHILQDLSKAGAILYVAVLNEIDKVSKESDKLIKDKEIIENNLKQIQIESSVAIEDLGGLKSNLVYSEKQISEIEETMENRFHSFKKDSELNLNPDKTIKENENTLNELTKKIALQKEYIGSLEQEVLLTKEKQQSNRMDLEKYFYQEKSLVRDIARYDEEKLKVLKKEELYQDLYQGVYLVQHIKDIINQIQMKIAKESVRKEKSTQRLLELEQNKIVGLTEKSIEIENYFKKLYNSAILGMDYLEGLDIIQKQEVLERIPYLPYSIILSDKEFGKAQKDMTLRERFADDYIYPILNLDAIRNSEKAAVCNDLIFFISRDTEIFINQDMVKKEKEKINKELSKLNSVLEELGSSLNYHTLNLKTIERFYDIFSETQYLENKKQLEETSQQIQTLKEEIEKNSVQVQSLEQKLEDQKLDYANNKSRLIELQTWLIESKQYLSSIEKLDQLQKEVTKGEKEKLRLEEMISNAIKTSQKFERERDSISQEIFDKKSQLSDLSVELSVLVAYKDKYVGDLIENLDYDKLKKEYEAINEVVSGKCKSLEDIDKQLLAIQGRMNDLKERIKEYNFDLVDLKELESVEGKLSSYTKENIQEHRHQVKDIEKEIKETNNQLVALKKQLGSYEGALENQIASILVNYAKVFEPLNIFNLEELNQLKNETEYQKLEIEKMLKQLNQEMLEASSYQTSLNKELDRAKHFISENAIVFKLNTSMNHGDISSFISDLKKLKNNAEECSKKTNRFIKTLIEKYQRFNIKDFVSTLQSEFKIPENLEETLSNIDKIDKVMDFVHLKFEKIQEDIENIQKYKENFVLQCVQRCEDVYKDLEKLQSLSRIVLNNIPRDMITLDIKLRNEEDRMINMGNYIDKIINEVESISEEDQMKLTLSNRLALKNLFAQIVIDMNKVKVCLYKVEELDRDSKYKPWEEAVGSAGQSNGLYMLFLICIISYIKKLNAKNEQMEIKKVVLVDNPFSSASAYYIWAPIIEVAKKNNTQLITPGHDIPKEILPMFEVRYLLKTEVKSDCTSVVVEDIISEIDMSKMEYKKMQVEQLMLE